MEHPASTARIEDLLAHAGWVRGLARRLLADGDQAEDVVQDAYVAALERPPGADVPARAWLAGVVRNLARMRRRGEGRRAHREHRVAEARRPERPTAEAVARMETQRTLADAVLALAEPYRTTVVLRYLDGLSGAEIARRLEVPAATVRSRLARGLAMLRRDLDRRHGGDGRAWQAALVPLARPAGPGAPVGEPPPVPTGTWVLPLTIQGWLAMKTVTKLALALLILAVAAGSAWWLDLLPGRGSHPAPHDLSAELAWRPLRADEKELGARLRGRSAPALAPPIGAPGPDETIPATDASVATLALRFVDETGRPVPGAVLVKNVHRHDDGPRIVTAIRADASGEIRASLAARTEGVRRWHAVAPGFATATVEALVRPGESRSLGDIVLGPGGAVDGRVVDPAGRPVSGALVHATDPALGPYARDRALVAGPVESALPFAVESNAVGGFRLTGLPVGRVRVWAVATGTRHAFSRPIEVRADQVTEGVELRLEPRRPTDTVEGVVRGPTGEPAPGAVIDYVYRRGGGMTSSSVRTDDAGRFEILTWGDGRLDLVARSRDGTFHAPPAEGLEPGARAVELRLREPPRVLVRVRGAHGPLETFQVHVLTQGRTSLDGWSGEGPHAGGETSVEVPFGLFELSVEAPGHARVLEGPYDATSVPRELTLRLEPIPGLTGRVLVGGKPLAGARVHLHREAAPDETIEHNGFAVRVDPQAAARATTDDLGRFRIDVREAGSYRLRAWADGMAPIERTGLALEPAVAAGPYELGLTPGGSVEGRVRPPAGSRADGRVVGISRGDGYPRTTRTDAQGHYRFEHLTPGPWEVRLVEEEIHPGTSSTRSTRGGSVRPLPVSCEVTEGRVTRHDLGEAGGRRVRLEGRIRLGGVSPAGWKARLRRPGVLTMEPEAAATIDAEGRFLMEVGEPDDYVLNVEVTAEGAEDQIVVAFLALDEGTTAWTLDLDAGALRGRVRGMDLGAGEQLLHLWWDQADTYVLSTLRPDEDGAFEIGFVPAGAGRIVHFDRKAMMATTTEARPRPENWTVLRSFVVTAGETLEVALD